MDIKQFWSRNRAVIKRFFHERAHRRCRDTAEKGSPQGKNLLHNRIL